jgi:two-component sensor histidine kinase
LKAKTMLLHEVDHRTKNNLQLINSLLMLQARRVTDEASRNVLRATQERIEALGAVQRLLYQEHDVDTFDLSAFIRDLAGNLIAAGGRTDIETEFQLEAIEIAAPKAASLGLLINEVLTNAMKHAFVNERAGRIILAARKDGGDLRIKIADDGVGVRKDVPDRRTFGTTLIETLARQLRATLRQSDGNPGTVIEIAMPLDSVST